MAKKTYKNVTGTSFHDVTFKATVDQLTKAFGEPYDNNSGDDKVNFEWDMETDEGDVFTIYDWKHYRKLDLDEVIEWHIGSLSRMISWDALDEITMELSN
jgi:hypothetical protein